MSRRRKIRGRDISGIILLDKPIGVSSNEALQQVKGIFNAQKAGHTGSLDPLATGLLPICFGEATKFSNYILTADKSYATECLLGVTTTTADAEGDVIDTCEVPALSEQHVIEVLESFLGESYQIPPMYSALKQNGQPLYKLARQGIEVEREPRRIWIENISLKSLSDNKLSFDVNCSKGTYVRTLTEDIGKKLGCGAHVTELRRFDLGVFHIDESVTLEKLNVLRDEKAFTELDEYILPIEVALTNWPRISLTDDSAFYVKQGQAVQVPKSPTEGSVTLFNSADLFMGIGEVQGDGKIKPSRLLKS
ncbi:MAG: tRNA pseudouridine(55) synthase TruB [Gammaproteobacteria bacterium]|nr:tRNA pseudouridine(55) synthase TruB [Gammaproteobacteria bacterium]